MARTRKGKPEKWKQGKPPDQIITTDPTGEKADRRWKEYSRSLVEEMKQPELAAWHVAALREVCGDSLSKAQALYSDLAENIWGPIGLAYLEWVYSTVPDDAILLFALRDAGWLHKLLITHHRVGLRHIGLHLNRPLLNIRDDDIADEDMRDDGGLPDQVSERELRKYLRDLIDDRHRDKIVLVDTGCWGRVLQALWQKFRLKLPSRFFFSHNDYVPSWMQVVGMPPELGEILCDSMETALPFQYRRAEELKPVRGGASAPVLYPQGAIQKLLYEATSIGLERAQIPEDPYDALRSALSKYVAARESGVWTGVLRCNVPTWEGGTAFLDKFPAELRALPGNPPEILPGGLNPRRRKIKLTHLGL